MRAFRKIAAWKLAYDLVIRVYKLTETFPQDEELALRSDIRKAAIMVPGQIAHGYGRGRKQDFLVYLHRAAGYLGEMRGQLELALELGFLKQDAFDELDQECATLDHSITKLMRKVAAK
jgi:four helix bundle protein